MGASPEEFFSGQYFAIWLGNAPASRKIKTRRGFKSADFS